MVNKFFHQFTMYYVVFKESAFSKNKNFSSYSEIKDKNLDGLKELTSDFSAFFFTAILSIMVFVLWVNLWYVLIPLFLHFPFKYFAFKSIKKYENYDNVILASKDFILENNVNVILVVCLFSFRYWIIVVVILRILLKIYLNI